MRRAEKLIEQYLGEDVVAELNQLTCFAHDCHLVACARSLELAQYSVVPTLIECRLPCRSGG